MKLRGVKAFTLGLFVSTALSGAALAADVEAYQQHDWTGFYVGGHVGYGSIDLEGRYDTVDGEDFVDDNAGRFDLDDDGFLGGFQAGYNHQIDNLVLGIEGDLAFVSWDDDLTNVRGREVSFDTGLVATVRARAGLAVDNLLLFGTVGAAWTDTNYEADDNDPSPNPSGDVDLDDIGLAVGGGAEYALDERWSIKADALYMIFDDKEKNQNLTDDSEIGDFIKLDDIFVIRVGVNFRL